MAVGEVEQEQAAGGEESALRQVAARLLLQHNRGHEQVLALGGSYFAFADEFPCYFQALTRLEAQRALELLHPLEPGFDLLAPDIHAVHRRLCRNGAWLLGLSKSPDEAIALISANIDRLSRTASAAVPGEQ